MHITIIWKSDIFFLHKQTPDVRKWTKRCVLRRSVFKRLAYVFEIASLHWRQQGTIFPLLNFSNVHYQKNFRPENSSNQKSNYSPGEEFFLIRLYSMERYVITLISSISSIDTRSLASKRAGTLSFSSATLKAWNIKLTLLNTAKTWGNALFDLSKFLNFIHRPCSVFLKLWYIFVRSFMERLENMEISYTYHKTKTLSFARMHGLVQINLPIHCFSRRPP